MIARLAQERFRAFGALEPKMGVVVPGKADSAMNLYTFGRGVQIGLGGRGLGQTGQRGPFRIVRGGGLRGVIGGGLGQLHFEQQVGQLVLDRLKRADCPSELHAHLGVIYG